MTTTPELEQSLAAATKAAPEAEPNGKIKFESVLQRSEAAAYFAALADGLRQGQLRFRHGDERLSLNPAEQVEVELKASRKGEKEKVAFELTWRRGGDSRTGLEE